MQVLIDCNKVFERLTRGPFPNGSQADTDVQKHLAACHECRCLAESLRPAVTLLHESMTAEQRADLPEYRSADEEEQRVRILDRIADQPPPAWEHTSYGSQSNRWRDLCWVLAPALLLAVMALAMHSDRSPIGDRTRQIALGSFSSVDLLTSFSLPAACLPEFSASQSNPVGMNNAFQCCSKCHAAMNPDAPHVRCMGQLTTACLACHSSARAANCCLKCHETSPQAMAQPALASASCTACHQG